MNKQIFFILGLSFILVFSGCDTKLFDDSVINPIDGNDQPKSEDYCQVNDDCVPKPGCHPSTCINKVYTDDYEAPKYCTEQYVCDAAYSAKDCACQNNKCVNTRLGKDCLE